MAAANVPSPPEEQLVNVTEIGSVLTVKIVHQERLNQHTRVDRVWHCQPHLHAHRAAPDFGAIIQDE